MKYVVLWCSGMVKKIVEGMHNCVLSHEAEYLSCAPKFLTVFTYMQRSMVDMGLKKGSFNKLMQFLEGSWNHEYFGSLAK